MECSLGQRTVLDVFSVVVSINADSLVFSVMCKKYGPEANVLGR